MRRTLSKFGFLMALLAAVSMVGSNTAYATPGAGGGVVQGAGTIGSTGLNFTPVPNPQTFTFSGTVTGAVVVGTNAGVGTMNCTFSGDDQLGNVVAGLGNLTGTCNGTAALATVPGATISVSANGTYIRAGGGVLVVMTTNMCVNSPSTGPLCGSGAATAELVFIAGSTPPIKTYSVVGVTSGFVI